MATTHLRREKFDASRDFVATKDMTFNGKRFTPGSPFDKSLVFGRRLRQLYDARHIQMVETDVTVAAGEAASDPASKLIDATKLKNNELTELLEANGVVPRPRASRAWLIRKAQELSGVAPGEAD